MEKDLPKDITVKLPRKLHEDVGEFIKTSKGKRFTNETDFYKEAVRRLLSEYELKSGIRYRGRDEYDNVILKDYDLDEIVTLSIKKSKRKEPVLICNTCTDPNCPHRNFIKGYQPLWDFLRRHDLKIVRYDNKNGN